MNHPPKLLVLALLLLLIVPAGPAASGPALPTRPHAVWVVRDAMTSPGRIRKMVREVSEAGVTDLIVQVRGRGDAYYTSRLVPPAADLVREWELHGRFDPLAMVLDEAHTRGLRVHAWINVYLVQGIGSRTLPGHVLATHGDWVTQDSHGVAMSDMGKNALTRARVEGVYLEPGNRQVVEHLLAVVDELLQGYAIDGIHLDYARYPLIDVGYSPVMRAGFERRTGIDPLELRVNREALVAELGPEGTMELERAWWGFKADQVSALVKQLSGLCRARRPDLILSAAVKPEPHEAFSRAGQDWTRWIQEGWIDVAAPMMYSTSGTKVRAQAEALVRLVPPDRLWAGIAVYNQSLSAAEDKIRTVREAGVEGVSIFSYNSIPGGAAALGQLNRVR